MWSLCSNLQDRFLQKNQLRSNFQQYIIDVCLSWFYVSPSRISIFSSSHDLIVCCVQFFVSCICKLCLALLIGKNVCEASYIER